MKKLTNKKGFTLVELLVVVAIIAVLMLLALPRFLDSTKGAKIRTFESNYRSILSAVSQYSAINSGSYEGVAKGFTAGSGTAAPTLGQDATEVARLVVSLHDKPKGAKYSITDEKLTGEIPGSELGVKTAAAGAASTKGYKIEYTFSTDKYVVDADTSLTNLSFKSN